MLAYPCVGEVDGAQGRRVEGGGGGGGGAAVQRGVQPPHSILPGPPVQLSVISSRNDLSTGWPGCLVLRQGAVNQLFLGVFLMFLACLDHARWAQFHSGILGPQE